MYLYAIRIGAFCVHTFMKWSPFICTGKQCSAFDGNIYSISEFTKLQLINLKPYLIWFFSIGVQRNPHKGVHVQCFTDLHNGRFCQTDHILMIKNILCTNWRLILKCFRLERYFFIWFVIISFSTMKPAFGLLSCIERHSVFVVLSCLEFNWNFIEKMFWHERVVTWETKNGEIAENNQRRTSGWIQTKKKRKKMFLFFIESKNAIN